MSVRVFVVKQATAYEMRISDWISDVCSSDLIVDLATLTGAMVISLWHEYAGVFSNDDKLAEQLTAAGTATGDLLWRFPLGEAYDKQIESQIADMKNMGPRYGGLITAAPFLNGFVAEGGKWAHLDIVGKGGGAQA